MNASSPGGCNGTYFPRSTSLLFVTFSATNASSSLPDHQEAIEKLTLVLGARRQDSSRPGVVGIVCLISGAQRSKGVAEGRERVNRRASIPRSGKPAKRNHELAGVRHGLGPFHSQKRANPTILRSLCNRSIVSLASRLS